MFIVTVIVIKIKERFGNTKTSKKITRMKSNDLSLYRDAIFKFKKGLVDKLSEITKIFNWTSFEVIRVIVYLFLCYCYYYYHFLMKSKCFLNEMKL